MSPALRRLAGVTAALVAGTAALFAFARAHDGPLGPLPGGALRSGELASGPPGDWTQAGVGETIELEVRPRAPWSVTTWAVVHGGELYVPADFLNPVKLWPRFVQDDPRVVVRLPAPDAGAAGSAARRFPLLASRVDDPALVSALRDAFAAKYGLAPDGLAARTEVWFFRLGPRG